MLNGAFFAVCKFNFDGLGATNGCSLAIGLRRRNFVDSLTLLWPSWDDWGWFSRFAVPFWIFEMLVGFDEVVDGEVVFAVKEAGTASKRSA